MCMACCLVTPNMHAASRTVEVPRKASPCHAVKKCHVFCVDGTVQSEDCLLLELEDVAKAYKRPSIIDIKVMQTAV